MKYIMMETSKGAKFPVLFPDVINHDDMAMAMGRLIARAMNAGSAAVSAGFVRVDELHVSGRSESLNIDCNPVDAVRIYVGDPVAYMPDGMLPDMKHLKKMQAEAEDDRP